MSILDYLNATSSLTTNPDCINNLECVKQNMFSAPVIGLVILIVIGFVIWAKSKGDNKDEYGRTNGLNN